MLLPFSEEETVICLSLGIWQLLVRKELNSKFMVTVEENTLFELLLSRVNKHSCSVAPFLFEVLCLWLGWLLLNPSSGLTQIMCHT